MLLGMSTSKNGLLMDFLVSVPQNGFPVSLPPCIHLLTNYYAIRTAKTTFLCNIAPPSCGTKDASLNMCNLIWLSRSNDGVDTVFGTQYPESRHRSCGAVLWFLAGCVVSFPRMRIGNVVKR